MLSEPVVRPVGQPARSWEAASHFLNLALYAFAVVGWELILILIEPWLVDPLARGSLGAGLLHWCLTGVGWLVGGLLLLRFARRRYKFGLEPTAAKPSIAPQTALRWGVVLALVVACIAARWIAQGGTPKPIAEFTAFARDFGDDGWIAMTAQYAYYLAEAFVIVLIIAFGQRAGDLGFSRRAVPWGGLVLASTWGAMHFLLQGASGGLYSVAAALAYGGIYLLCGRRMSLALPLIAVAFML